MRVLLATNKIDSYLNVFVHGFSLALFGVIPRIMLGTAITWFSISQDWKYMLMLTVIGMIG